MSVAERKLLAEKWVQSAKVHGRHDHTLLKLMGRRNVHDCSRHIDRFRRRRAASPTCCLGTACFFVLCSPIVYICIVLTSLSLSKIGADAVACLPPYYNPPATLDLLMAFLQPIEAAANGLPMFYYHLPGTMVYFCGSNSNIVIFTIPCLLRLFRTT